jgi:hypothetical protein
VKAPQSQGLGKRWGSRASHDIIIKPPSRKTWGFLLFLATKLDINPWLCVKKHKIGKTCIRSKSGFVKRREAISSKDSTQRNALMLYA